MINLIKQLREIGLKQNESEIYLYLLQNGIATPPQIARGTNIARTNCYNILVALKEKGVIDEHIKGKRKVYVARTPESLKLGLERKLESVARLLPDLEALHITQKNKPSFRFYDGWAEVKEIYKLSLGALKIYGLGSTERLSSIDKDFFDKYVNQIHKNKVDFQDLLTANSKNSAHIIKEIRGEAHKINFASRLLAEHHRYADLGRQYCFNIARRTDFWHFDYEQTACGDLKNHFAIYLAKNIAEI